jgi:hypothetical protein
MTTRMLNAIPRENAADYRRALAGKPLKALKRSKGPKCLVEPYFSYNPRTGVYLIQLPEHLEQPREFVPPKWMSDARVRNVLQARRSAYEALRGRVANEVERYMPQGVIGLQHIEYVRLSNRALNIKTEMDDDNLWACFKPVRDAVCAYARWHHEWRAHVKHTFGQADGYLKQQGVKWTYRQAKCASNKRAHGIQIRLHCSPRAAEPSPDSETSPTS